MAISMNSASALSVSISFHKRSPAVHTGTPEADAILAKERSRAGALASLRRLSVLSLFNLLSEFQRTVPSVPILMRQFSRS